MRTTGNVTPHFGSVTQYQLGTITANGNTRKAKPIEHLGHLGSLFDQLGGSETAILHRNQAGQPDGFIVFRDDEQGADATEYKTNLGKLLAYFQSAGLFDGEGAEKIPGATLVRDTILTDYNTSFSRQVPFNPNKTDITVQGGDYTFSGLTESQPLSRAELEQIDWFGEFDLKLAGLDQSHAIKALKLPGVIEATRKGR